MKGSPDCARAMVFRRLSPCLWVVLATGCAFNFELTSQRTALENQILGSYQELDDDLVLVSSVRSLDSDGKKKDSQVSDLQQQALRAKQNQDFNRDDVEELKRAQILGETADGTLSVLPAGTGQAADTPKDQLNIASLVLAEENRDRNIIWHRIIQMNENLSEKDLASVRETFAKQAFEQAKTGDWLRDKSGRWVRKTSAAEGSSAVTP